MPVFECGTVWSPVAEGPFFNATLVLKIQLAILKTPKNMSWPRLARPRDLVGSLVWRGDDRATDFIFLYQSLSPWSVALHMALLHLKRVKFLGCPPPLHLTVALEKRNLDLT